MSVYLRIPSVLCELVRKDVERPHSLAAERVGFLKARLGTGEGSDRIVLFTGYSAVADGHYVDDPTSGARISGDAIRVAMQTILEEEVGLFHVHMHNFPGVPSLGRMDRREIPELVRTFRATNPSHPHGIFLLSQDTFFSSIWLPGKTEPLHPKKSTVVGAPLAMVLDVND